MSTKAPEGTHETGSESAEVESELPTMQITVELTDGGLKLSDYWLKVYEECHIEWVSVTNGLEIVGVYGLRTDNFSRAEATKPAGGDSLRWRVTDPYRPPYGKDCQHHYSILAVDTTTGLAYFKDPKITNEEPPKPKPPS